MNILAVTIGGLGDAILFSPAVKALRARYPQAFIRLLVASELAKSVYGNALEIDRIDLLETRGRGRVRPLLHLLKFCFQSRRHVGGYDLGVYATGINPNLSRVMKALGGIHSTVFAPVPPEYPTDLDCNVALARRFDPSASETDAFVPVASAAEKEADAALAAAGLTIDDPLIAVYPSTELVHRIRWPLSKIVALVDKIKKAVSSLKIIVVGDCNEGRQWADADTARLADANLAGVLTIGGSAALLRRCRLAIGNDGGLMHVAGAVGCPLVVIMVNTPPTYQPPGRHTTVIRSSMNCCNATYPARPDWCREAVCRESIPSDTVYQACARILGSKGKDVIA
jgi:ADP-heptose:LPS heptosyltransferase